jgi:hypothetical protein
MRPLHTLYLIASLRLIYNERENPVLCKLCVIVSVVRGMCNCFGLQSQRTVWIGFCSRNSLDWACWGRYRLHLFVARGNLNFRGAYWWKPLLLSQKKGSLDWKRCRVIIVTMFTRWEARGQHWFHGFNITSQSLPTIERLNYRRYLQAQYSALKDRRLFWIEQEQFERDLFLRHEIEWNRGHFCRWDRSSVWHDLHAMVLAPPFSRVGKEQGPSRLRSPQLNLIRHATYSMQYLSCSRTSSKKRLRTVSWGNVWINQTSQISTDPVAVGSSCKMSFELLSKGDAGKCKKK